MDLIEAAVGHVASRLNEHLRRSFGLPEDVVEVSGVLEQDGTVAPNIDNKLVLFLVNIERDGASPLHGNGAGLVPGSRAVGYPPVHLNLYVMVAAHFPGANYREALKFISGAIAFFQGNPVFSPTSSPDLDPGIDRLVMEIENLSLQELSHLWGVLAGKYLPSVLYKMRMVTVDSGSLRGITPSLRDPRTEVAPGGGG